MNVNTLDFDVQKVSNKFFSGVQSFRDNSLNSLNEYEIQRATAVEVPARA